MTQPWFGPKAYGIGLSPKGAKGWLALGLYVLGMIATGPVVALLRAPTWAIWITFTLLTAALFALIVLKSDRRPWRWRWGGE
jgi:hypothetical protein